MRKITPTQKKWYLSKSKKEIRRRQKRNHERRKKNSQPLRAKSNHMHKEKHHIVTAPDVFSIFESPTNTLAFFKSVSSALNNLEFKYTIYFDLSNVVTVSVDAIMYLIALIKNTKRAKTLQINCAGNMPKNKTARSVFETSGFYQYVSPNYSVNNRSNRSAGDHINITQGHEADPVLAGHICDFVHTHSAFTRSDTKSLFTMVMELMANTKQHAYNGNRHMDNNWYIFVEDTPDYLHFVFLDTGDGIPNTVRTKGLIEKIQNVLNYKDAYFIASALRGEVRSETGLEYRGKGLPEIYNRACNNYIADFSIISGNGRCDIHENGTIQEVNQTNALTGTMLCWKLVKTV